MQYDRKNAAAVTGKWIEQFVLNSTYDENSFNSPLLQRMTLKQLRIISCTLLNKVQSITKIRLQPNYHQLPEGCTLKY